jgi:hypothetical protein
VVSAPATTQFETRPSTCGPGNGRSRLAEDVVSPDAPPYDVGLAGLDPVAVLKRCPAIGSPGHLEDSRCALNALDPQALPELTNGPEVLDQRRDRRQEGDLLFRAEANEVSPETREPVERGQT